MEETAALIQAVESFEESQDSWTHDLERFIAHVARTGDILAPWEKVQKVFMNKLRLVLDEFYSANPYRIGKVNANATNDDFEEMKTRLLQLTEEFDSPPFTIQRLCELLADPKKNYTKCDKFMRGVEKNLMVVSSWNNTPRRSTDGNDSMVNGVSTGASNGFLTNDRLKPHWANLPPSPVATAPPKIPGAPDFTDISQPKLQSADEETTKEEKKDTTSEPISSTAEDKMIPSGGDAAGDEHQPTAEHIDLDFIVSEMIKVSPPVATNTKRKIDDSTDESATSTTKEPEDPLVAESPTKKLKSDAPETEQQSLPPMGQNSSLVKEEEKAEESPEKKPKLDAVMETKNPEESPLSSTNDSSENNDDSKLENDTKSSNEPSVVKDTAQTDVQMESTENSSKEGTSVDPPEKSDESQMEVD